MMLIIGRTIPTSVIAFYGDDDDDEFPAGTIVRDPLHHESLTRCEQDLNLNRT